MLRLTLKIQCPRCGSGLISRRERKSWMRLIPRSRLFVCRSCRQHFLVFGGLQKPVENRRYPRIQLSNKLFARMEPGGQELGSVKEISRGGMAFLYIADHDPPSGTFRLEVVCKGNGAGLRNISVTAVSDAETDLLAPYSNIPVRSRGLRFEDFGWRQWARLRWLAFRCKGS